jgi:hypothetical protein
VDIAPRPPARPADPRIDRSAHAGSSTGLQAFQSCMDAIQVLLESYRSDLARTQYCETNCIR